MKLVKDIENTLKDSEKISEKEAEEAFINRFYFSSKIFFRLVNYYCFKCF